MKNTIVKIALSSVLASGLLVAGKGVIETDIPVVPVVDVNPLYVGLGLLWSGTSAECPCAVPVNDRRKDTTYGVIGRIGYDFNQYIGIEGRVLKASIEKDFSETTHYGIYLKPQYHVTEAINIYGLIGYGKTKIEFTCPTISDQSDSGLSVGIGVEYDISSDTDPIATSRAFDGQGDQEKGWGVWVDYQNLLHNKGSYNIKSNIVTAGVTYDF
ncbi:MAG: porin family protein [Sulfurovum sp.]|nr:porin family protein [Sulfurovum sp.]